jgi:transcriptional regulator with XRE-family HTH domain
MGKSLDRLNELAAGRMSTWHEEADWYRKNIGWLKRSSKIAFRILSELEKQGISQKELALRMGVTPQYVNKIVKGKENLSLETIWKIEEALGIILISVDRNVAYFYPETTLFDPTHAKIPLTESLSTKVSEEYISYEQSSLDKDDAA